MLILGSEVKQVEAAEQVMNLQTLQGGNVNPFSLVWPRSELHHTWNKAKRPVFQVEVAERPYLVADLMDDHHGQLHLIG